jgi:hypothetical protein
MRIPIERCPDGVRRFAATAECAKCETKQGTGLAAVVSYQPPMYVVLLTCVKCARQLQATFLGPGPTTADPEPEPPVEKPSWYAHVEVGK